MNKYSDNILSNTREDKFELILKGEREYLYSGWEINQITTHLNNSYYKNELLNTIKSELLNGTKPENIWILNDSIKLNNAYINIESGLLNLNSENDLLKFFYLGSPISLIPNKYSYKLFYLLEIIRTIFRMSNVGNLTPINRKKSLEYLIAKKDKLTNSEELKSAIRNLLVESNNEKIKKDSKIIKKIDKILSTSLKVYKLWDDLNEDKQLDLIIQKDSLAEYSETKSHFLRFRNTFKNFEKPIVCIYKAETNEIEIICIDMIARSYFNEENARLLETKSISQNSPLLISIGIGIGFLPVVLKLSETIRNVIQTRKELVATINQLEVIAESDKAKIAENDKWIEKLMEVNSLTTEKTENVQVTNLSDIAYNYIAEIQSEEMETLEKHFKTKNLIVENLV